MIHIISYTFLSKIVVAACKLMLSALVARYLGPEGKGIFTFFTRLIGMIVTFVNFSIGEFYIYIANSCPDNIRSRFILNTTIGLGLITVLACIVLKYAGSLFEDLVLSSFPIALVIFSGLAIHFNYHQSKRYQALREYQLYIFQSIFVHVFMMTSGIIAVFIYGDIIPVLYAVSLGFLLGCVFSLIFETKIKKKQNIYTLSQGTEENWYDVIRKRGVIKYCTKIHLIESFCLIQAQVDVLMLGYLTSFSAAGIYSVGVTIAQLTFYFSNSVTTILFPEMVRNSNEDKLFRRIALSMFAGSFINLPLVFCVGFLIQTLYGVEFIEAKFIYFIIIPGIIADLAFRIMYAYLKSVSETTHLVVITAGCVVLNITLNIILISRFGIYGAAVATLVCYVVRSMLVVIFSRGIIRRIVSLKPVLDKK